MLTLAMWGRHSDHSAASRCLGFGLGPRLLTQVGRCTMSVDIGTHTKSRCTAYLRLLQHNLLHTSHELHPLFRLSRGDILGNSRASHRASLLGAGDPYGGHLDVVGMAPKLWVLCMKHTRIYTYFIHIICRYVFSRFETHQNTSVFAIQQFLRPSWHSCIFIILHTQIDATAWETRHPKRDTERVSALVAPRRGMNPWSCRRPVACPRPWPQRNTTENEERKKGRK